MAKQSRAKRPIEGGLSDIHLDSTNTTAPVADLPFSIDVKEPVNNREMSPAESKEFELDIKTPAGNKVVVKPESDGISTDTPSSLPAKTISFDVSNIKFDVNQAQIDEYKELVPTLVIKDVTDREGYAKIVETRKKIKKARTTLENARKSLVEDANKYTSAVNGTAKKYKDQLEPLEAILEEKETWFEEEQVRLDREKEQAELKRVQERTAILITSGCSYDGKDFSYGSTLITADQLITLSDEEFTTQANSISTAHEAVLKQQKEDADAAEALRLDNEKKQLNLENERKEMLKEKVDFRIYQLEHAGLTLSKVDNGFFFGGDITVSRERIENAGASDWQKILADIIARISKFNADEKERERLETEEKSAKLKKDADDYLQEQVRDLRKQQVESLGFEFTSEEPGIVAKHRLYGLHLLEEDYGATENIWSEWYKKTVTLINNNKEIDNQNALKAEKRRGDLRALGLTIEDFAGIKSFVFCGIHVLHPFIADLDEALLKRNDDWWENTTIPGVKAKVAALKQADQEKISELLNQQTEALNSTKGDKENLQEINDKITSLSVQLTQYQLKTPNAIELLTKIEISFGKMNQLIKQQIELLTL